MFSTFLWHILTKVHDYIYMTDQQKIKVMKSLIDIPNHKIVYIIRLKNYVDGLWGNLERYGIEHTQENHELFVEVVQAKLVGPHIEREWTEDEYENFVKFEVKDAQTPMVA